MNYIKEKIGKGLYVPQMAEKARQIGVQQVDHVEKQFPYLDQTLPSHEMTIDEKEKRLKKIENISNGLDNIFPWCPIPIGIGSVLGFVPFIGGTMGSILSVYQIYLSTTLGIPIWLLIRMLLNIVIAFLLSLIPLLGGFLHMFYKSNSYNFEELNSWMKGQCRSSSAGENSDATKKIRNGERKTK